MCLCLVFLLGSHRRSDQLDRPNRPNSPTKLDQTRSSSTNCLIGVAGRYSTMHDHHTTIHNSSTTSTNHPDLYTIISTPTRLQYSTNLTSTRPIPERLTIYSIATRLFSTCPKISRRKPIKVDHPDLSCRSSQTSSRSAVRSENLALVPVHQQRSHSLYSSVYRPTCVLRSAAHVLSVGACYFANLFQ